MKFNIDKKIKQLLLVLVFILPFNFAYILNFDNIQNFQFFSESLKYSIYFFDILFVLIIVLWLYRKYQTKKLLNFLKFNGILLAIIAYFIWNSVSISANTTSSIYVSGRLIEVMIFFLIFIDLIKTKKFFNQATYLIFISGAIQSTIAFLQFVFQKSLGLKYLGESVLSSQLLGVAKLEAHGEKFIRSYGTFPHPNVLGAFLLLSLMAGLYFISNNNFKIPFSLPVKLKKLKLTNKTQILSGKLHFFLGLIIILAGIISSFSRSIWLITFILSLILTLRYSKYLLTKKSLFKSRFKYIVPIVIILATLIFGFHKFIPARLCPDDCQDQSATLRTEYSNFCKKEVLRNNYWTGVGIGQFPIIFKTLNPGDLPAYNIQPVHNLYLLAWSEIGLIGLILLALFITKNFKAFKFSKKTELFSLLIIGFLLLGFFDHYFWSLPQGQFILWLALALLATSGKINGNTTFK